MINQSIIFIPQTDCTHAKLKPFAQLLDVAVFFDQDLHFGSPLAKVFNNVIRFEIGEPYANEGVMQANKKIIDLVKEHSPKYLIWPTRNYEILEETLQEVRKLGTYVIGGFYDDETRFDDYSRWWLPYMDYIFTADKASVSRYQELGAKAYHVPVTCEPEDFHPSLSDASYEVSFVGSKYVGDRAELVERFLNDGVTISAFGKGWGNGFVSHDEMAQIFFNSKINICFTKSQVGKNNQLKGKIFDITMCGGFLLCEYVEGIEDVFEVGKEVVCFNSYTEALEKIHYFLEHKEEREQIAAAGKRKAVEKLAQHKFYEKAFVEVEKDIELKKKRVVQQVSISQMPVQVRNAHAQFHLKWATVLKETNFEKKYWQDEFDLANKYVSSFTRLKLKYGNKTSLFALMKKVRNKLNTTIRK